MNDDVSRSTESPQTDPAASLSTQPLPLSTHFIHTVIANGVIRDEDQPVAGNGTVAAEPAASPTVRAAGSGEERLIYSNTLGWVAVDFGANRLISDDIATTALSGCALSGFSFDVHGRVNEALAGGPYTVTWALYNTCPYAVTSGLPRNARIIEGTAGTATFEDDLPRTIEVILSEPVSIPTYV